MPISPLPPLYFAAPTIPPLSADPDVEDAAPALQPGDTFEVLWYSQVGVYTLVHWRWGEAGVTPLRPSPTASTGTEGESLYQGEQMICWDWYEIPLGVYDPVQEKVAQKAPDPRARINQGLGRFGLSTEAATKLRAAEYRVTFTT